MRRWTVAVVPMLCGSKGCRIDVDHPVQEISVAGMSRRLYRCLECAEGEVNWEEVDLERFRLEQDRQRGSHALPSSAPVTRVPARAMDLVPASAVEASVFERDHKLAATGERNVEES